MARRSGGVPLERLREVLAERVEAGSLRSVAQAVGMSPSGLQKILDGATPYSATQQRIERWFVRESARYRAEPSEASFQAALTVLTQGLPPTKRAGAIARLVGVLIEAYSSRERKPPKWLLDMRSGAAARKSGKLQDQ